MTEQAVEAQDVAPATEPTQDTAFAIPDAYQKAEVDGKTTNGWTDKVKSSDDLWQLAANSQKLIGDKGAFLPQEGATDEDVSAFIDKLEPFKDKINGKFNAVPEAYEFAPVELPEGREINAELQGVAADAFKKAGITNEQANIINSEYTKAQVGMIEAQEAATNEEFNNLAKEKWGEKWEDAVVEAGAALRDNLPDEMKEQMSNIPNQYLVPMIAAIDEMRMKMQPDGAPTETNAAHGMSDEELIAQRQKLRQEVSANPTKENMDKWKAMQDKARGKR